MKDKDIQSDWEINESIAEFLGWSRDHRGWFIHPKGMYQNCPNFCQDLNANHEAKKSLSLAQSVRFAEELYAIIKRRCAPNIDYQSVWMLAIDAEPIERAKAFLRTVGKWKEGE